MSQLTFVAKFSCSARKHVGGTHTIVRLHIGIRRKDGTENFGGLVLVLDCVQRDFVLWVFVCSVNLSLFSGYHAEGYHARTDIQANRLPRLQGYRTRATTLHTNFWVQAGYHTCG